MKQTTLGIIIDGALAGIIAVAATVLLALHDVTETNAVLLYGVAITLVGGSAKSLLALLVPSPAQTVTPPAPVAPTLPPPTS